MCGLRWLKEETRCVGGQCYGEVCDKLGYGVTDVLGRASITFSTIPNEGGMPAAGTLENRMRAEFSGDDYYAAVASTGTLTLLPDVVDIRGTTIEVTRAGEPVAEVGRAALRGSTSWRRSEIVGAMHLDPRFHLHSSGRRLQFMST